MKSLSDPRRALSEMFRVLKPGGHIGVCSPDWSVRHIDMSLTPEKLWRALQQKNDR
jgi:ubiquinone/menaquinone biosynthesis C-methylase UbiE